MAEFGGWVAKLVARLLAMAALWVRIQTSLNHYMKGRHKQRSGQHYRSWGMRPVCYLTFLPDVITVIVFAFAFIVAIRAFSLKICFLLYNSSQQQKQNKCHLFHKQCSFYNIVVFKNVVVISIKCRRNLNKFFVISRKVIVISIKPCLNFQKCLRQLRPLSKYRDLASTRWRKHLGGRR